MIAYIIEFELQLR